MIVIPKYILVVNQLIHTLCSVLQKTCLLRACCVLAACLMCAWCVDACLLHACCMLAVRLLRSCYVLAACLLRAWCLFDACWMCSCCVLDACLKLAWYMLDACLICVWCLLGVYLLMKRLVIYFLHSICTITSWWVLSLASYPPFMLYPYLLLLLTIRSPIKSPKKSDQ